LGKWSAGLNIDNFGTFSMNAVKIKKLIDLELPINPENFVKIVQGITFLRSFCTPKFSNI